MHASQLLSKERTMYEVALVNANGFAGLLGRGSLRVQPVVDADQEKS